MSFIVLHEIYHGMRLMLEEKKRNKRKRNESASQFGVILYIALAGVYRFCWKNNSIFFNEKTKTEKTKQNLKQKIKIK